MVFNNIFITSPPLSYVRSGGINLSDGTTKFAGVHGYYWSELSAFSDFAGAQILSITGIEISAANKGTRWVAFPVLLFFLARFFKKYEAKETNSTSVIPISSAWSFQKNQAEEIGISTGKALERA